VLRIRDLAAAAAPPPTPRHHPHPALLGNTATVAERTADKPLVAWPQRRRARAGWASRIRQVAPFPS